jgi:UvrD-like helicase C-terminal domain
MAPTIELTAFDIPNMMSEIVLFPVPQRLAQRSPVAVLIPEDISATAVPPGERKFHSFLKILFESRPDVVGWHSIRVCGKEIDFSDSVIKMADSTQRRHSRKVGEVAMDHLQEKYAREIGGGPRLLKGVAGSGKTLVLLQRAIYKAKYDPSAKRILFTCYNLSLANHVRDMVGHNVPEDRRARITVKPFFDLFSLKEMGIDFRGRTHMLPASYRSTQQIFEFAHRLAGKDLPPAVDRETGQMMVFPQYAGRTGSAPVLETFPDPDRLVNHLITEVRHHIQVEKIPPAEIGILYLSKRTRPEPVEGAASPGGKRTLQSFEQLKGVRTPSVEEKSLPDRIASYLKGAGIPVNWFTENSAAKQSFDLHEPTVKIGTIHSAKGLDFEVVCLIDATGNPVVPPSKSVPVDDAARKYRNLLFVGCSRARERLVILSQQGSGNH